MDYLKECLDYDPETGIFRWKERPRHHFPTELGWKKVNAARKGKIAGTLNETVGYVTLSVGRKMYGAHRVAWLMSHGSWPTKYIDHINGKRSDNRIENLREATNSENMMNARTPRDNRSGVKGVSFHKEKRKWRADVVLRRKQHHLGYFNSISEAAEVVRKARLRLHGEFSNHGDSNDPHFE